MSRKPQSSIPYNLMVFEVNILNGIDSPSSKKWQELCQNIINMSSVVLFGDLISSLTLLRDLISAIYACFSFSFSPKLR